MAQEADTEEPAALEPEVEWKPNFPRLRELDRLWCELERWLCGGMFLIMSLLVFAAVVSAVFAARREWIDAGILFGFIYLGCRTRTVRDGEARLSQALSLAISAGGTVLVSLAVIYYTDAIPGGLPQAPALALCMMLWVALLGASITTFDRSHLALEFGEKIWPQRTLHIIKGIARALTAGGCLFLMWLSWIAVNERHDLWSRGDYRADLVPGLDEPFSLLFFDANGLPQWVVLVIIPYTFLAMAIRFGAQSYTVVTHQSKPEEEQLPT